MFNMNLFPYCEKIYTSYNSTGQTFSVRISKFDFGKGVDNSWVHLFVVSNYQMLVR